MPIQLQWENGGVLAEITGKLSLDDYRQVLKFAWQDSRYDGVHYVLLDSTKQAMNGSLSNWEIEVLAIFSAGVYKYKNFIVAVVVNPENQASVATAECYKNKAAHPHAVFTDIADARNWISDRLGKA